MKNYYHIQLIIYILLFIRFKKEYILFQYLYLYIFKYFYIKNVTTFLLILIILLPLDKNCFTYIQIQNQRYSKVSTLEI
jgi:hypothetical protein